jgi:hypothetical protein
MQHAILGKVVAHQFMQIIALILDHVKELNRVLCARYILYSPLVSAKSKKSYFNIFLVTSKKSFVQENCHIAWSSFTLYSTCCGLDKTPLPNHVQNSKRCLCAPVSEYKTRLVKLVKRFKLQSSLKMIEDWSGLIKSSSSNYAQQQGQNREMKNSSRIHVVILTADDVLSA